MLIDLPGRSPQIHPDAWIAPTATVIGDVVMEEGSSVWYGCVLRGDRDTITIGAGANIQDGSVLHTDPGLHLRIDAHVTVGHMAMLHGCHVKEGALIGIGARVLNGAVIGEGSIVAAGALVGHGDPGQGEARAGRRAGGGRAGDGGAVRGLRRRAPGRPGGAHMISTRLTRGSASPRPVAGRHRGD